MTIKNIFWFYALNLTLWCLASLVYFFTSGFYGDGLGVAFTLFSIPGHFFAFALGLFLLTVPFCLMGKRAAFVAAVAGGAFFALFLAADIFVYTQYRFHISMAMLELFFGPAGREIFVFPLVTYITLAACTIGGIGVIIALAHLSRKISWGKKPILTTLIFLLGCLFLYHCMHAWGKFMVVPSVLGQVSYLPWANPLSANRRLRDMGFIPKAEPYSLPSKGTLHYPLAPMQCNPSQTPNILIILIDSWRADSFSSEVTPHIYQAFSQNENSFYFTNHLSGGNATEAGVFSLFYSMPYAYWDSLTSRQLPPVFISELQRLGYQLGIFSSSKLNSPEFNQNVFSSISNLRIESKGNTKIERDLDIQKDFSQFLQTRNKQHPFFGFLFYDAAHGQEFPKGGEVFKPTAGHMNYLTLSKNTNPAPYMNRYKNAVYFVDGLIGQTFDLLQKQGLEQNTVVILTGDHGQEINDTHNNFWGHNSNFAKWQTHVPLLVWWPNKTGKKVDYRTAHYDIMPTLLTQALACQNPVADYSIGYSLFDPFPRPFTLISSYTKKAVQVGDNLSVIDAYSYLDNYNDSYKKTPQSVDPKALAEAFKTFSKFYK